MDEKATSEVSEKAREAPQRPRMELHLKSPLPGMKGMMLTSEQAEWNWSNENPVMLQVVVWKDRAQGLAEVHVIPYTSIRSIRHPRVQLSRIARPSPNLVVPGR